jgi:CheY-like chemotaxis protein
MKDIVEWLLSIESAAGAFYKAAAEAFRKDEGLARFLDHLAADEKWHHRVIGTAAGHLEEGAAPVSAFSLDPDFRTKIEEPFRTCNGKLADGSLTKDDVIECVALTEFSEWNHLFQYVINSLKEGRREYEPVAARMQQHKRYIEQFPEAATDIGSLLKRLRSQPPVWHARILIVEDYSPIREFLTMLLSERGAVGTAADGRGGLARVVESYYDVIVSDTDMPDMGGIEFFRRAEQIEPGIGRRFLFLTADPEDEEIAFLNRRGLRFLMKPARIRDISAAVEGILQQTAGNFVGNH